MIDTALHLAEALLYTFGAVFCLIGWLVFRLLPLNPDKAIRSFGELRGFREYASALATGDNYRDYPENRRGRRPVILTEIDGCWTEISSAWTDYSLDSGDLGKQFPILYQRKLGIVMLIDGERAIHDYRQKNLILFWSFMSVGLILIILGIIVTTVL